MIEGASYETNRNTNGGGDAPGLNAVIRAAVKTAIYEYDCEVFGIRNGYDGFIEEHGIIPLKLEDVRGILLRGETPMGMACAGYAYYHSIKKMHWLEPV